MGRTAPQRTEDGPRHKTHQLTTCNAYSSHRHHPLLPPTFFPTPTPLDFETEGIPFQKAGGVCERRGCERGEDIAREERTRPWRPMEVSERDATRAPLRRIRPSPLPGRSVGREEFCFRVPCLRPTPNLRAAFLSVPFLSQDKLLPRASSTCSTWWRSSRRGETSSS